MLGLGTLARKVFGTPNDRKVKSVRPIVAKINALEPEFHALTDDEIVARTHALQKRVQEGGESLDAIFAKADTVFPTMAQRAGMNPAKAAEKLQNWKDGVRFNRARIDLQRSTAKQHVTRITDIEGIHDQLFHQ